MKALPYKKMWMLLGVLTVIVILIAASVVLFISARLQQNLLTKAPQYDAAQLYSRGVDQVATGDYAAAEASLEQALKQQDDSSYKSELAVVKYRLKKYSESVALYQELISSGKDAAFGWNGTGNAYRDWADSDPAQADSLRLKAINAYKQAVILDPHYVAAYSNLALLYNDLGQTQNALDILTQGIAATSSQDLVIIRGRIAPK